MSKKNRRRGKHRPQANKRINNEPYVWPPPWDFQLMPVSEMDFDQLIAMDAYYNPERYKSLEQDMAAACSMEDDEMMEFDEDYFRAIEDEREIARLAEGDGLWDGHRGDIDELPF
jgi:hypothetical protein